MAEKQNWSLKGHGPDNIYCLEVVLFLSLGDHNWSILVRRKSNGHAEVLNMGSYLEASPTVAGGDRIGIKIYARCESDAWNL